MSGAGTGAAAAGVAVGGEEGDISSSGDDADSWSLQACKAAI